MLYLFSLFVLLVLVTSGSRWTLIMALALGLSLLR
jgi:hypothetical protein